METIPPSDVTDAPVLNGTERRVLGVLIEKGLTTPEYYPLTVKALVAGCNQKNNRDPLSQYDEHQAEQALKTLEQRGFVLSVIGDSGRVARWRQELARKYGLDVVELALLGELLLRGAQSEGDLRGRASRMRPIDTLETLREQLQKLRSPTPARPALVVRLSSESAGRGVRWTHALQPPDQLEQQRASEPEIAAAAAAPRTPGPPPASERSDLPELVDLARKVAALEERVARLEQQGPSIS